ncbi:uncharacterized protein LOC110667170 [Hevea brasiliensis]|uniref:uncharacterized protein LOC110667170 n=1 Tax=Hevea brasiliensis TaxID=3981 RepID=UPI0025DD1D5E|nr:uncharacterized protein LOC110667170 [Hevea brasiliensis]
MVPLIGERLKTVFSRQKSYADLRWKDVEFAMGDYVFLKVSLMKGVMRFRKKGKLAPQYIGPFEITDRPDTVELDEDLMFEEQHIAIVDYQIRQLRSKQIPMVKVL